MKEQHQILGKKTGFGERWESGDPSPSPSSAISLLFILVCLSFPFSKTGMICLRTAVLEAVFNAWKVLRAAQMKVTVSGRGNDGVSPSAGVSYPPLTSVDPHPFTPAEDLALCLPGY